MNKAGILLPIFSLPGFQGVGTLGKEAYRFVDYVKESGLHYWQILPLNPLDKSYSPYQTISSFAGETVYIDLEYLKELGLIDSIELEMFNHQWVDYRRVKMFKEPYFKKAFDHFNEHHPLFEDFISFKKNTGWLDKFCEFKVLFHLNDKTIWPSWTRFEIDERQKDFEAFKQFLFFKQWDDLKKYANDVGIEIIGDLPFYIGFNSDDVYFNQDLFKLDDAHQPTCVSGVPPDYFNPDGQRWNHPIYDWEAMKKQDFSYWIEKIKQACQIVDILRLDHFRAFDTYWEVEANSHGAKNGQWIEAPGDALFSELFYRYPELKIIVEDLGYLREEVYQLKNKYDLMGMKIMQFSFDETLHDQIPENCLFYTGTHDNDTLKGWRDKEQLNIELDELLKMAMNSKASVVIVPLQDFLHLDSSHRINSPGTEGEYNWTWRIDSLDAFKQKVSMIKDLLIECHRI